MSIPVEELLVPVLSNVKNVFKVADLRNKVLFTIMIVGLYRLGVAIQVPGVDQLAVDQLRETRPKAAVRSDS